MSEIAIVAELALTVVGEVGAKNGLDVVAFPLHGFHGGVHHRTDHTHHTRGLFGSQFSRAMGILAVVSVLTMTLFKNVFAHGRFVVAAVHTAHGTHAVHTAHDVHTIHATHSVHGNRSAPRSQLLRSMGVLASSHFCAVSVFGEGNAHGGLVPGIVALHGSLRGS